MMLPYTDRVDSIGWQYAMMPGCGTGNHRLPGMAAAHGVKAFKAMHIEQNMIGRQALQGGRA